MGFVLIRKAASNQWFWQLKGKNNKTLAHSEIYESEEAAKKGIASARVNALSPRIKVVR